MSYPKKIFNIRPTGGIANDIPAFEVAPEFYTQGTNIQFRDGFAERTTGHSQVYNPLSDTLRAIQNVQIGGINYWIYHSTNKSWAVTISTHTDITHAAGLASVTAGNTWAVGSLNGIPFATNGQNEPMYWDGDITHKFVTLPGWTATNVCKSLRAYKDFLIAMDISTGAGDFVNQVLWSNSAQPGTMPTAWTASATNDAGDNILADTPGRIIDGEGLKSAFLLYKQHSSYMMEFSGGNDVFTFNRLSSNSGILAKNCATEVSQFGRHFTVTDGDIVLTDGYNTESIAESRMKKFLFNQLDQTNYQSCFVRQYPKQKEVWIFFPSAGNTFCDLALVWYYGKGAGGAWGVREVPLISCANLGIINDTAGNDTWDGDSGTWDTDFTIWNQQSYSESEESLVLGKPNDASPTSSKLLRLDSGTTFDGSSIGANVGKYAMTFEEPDRIKLIKRVFPKVQASNGVVLMCRVGSQNAIGEAITWTNEMNYTVGTSQYVDLFAQGKLLSFEFRSEGGAPWILTGFDVEGEIRGYH